jgi:hypothetical protein
MEEEYVSECCFASPGWELDMSSAYISGPSGYCSRCQDNCIFFIPCRDCGTIEGAEKRTSSWVCKDCHPIPITLGHEY